MTDFKIDVIVDPRRARPGIRTVERGLGRLENRADRFRLSIGRALALFGGGAILRNAVRVLAQFEQSMSTVAAVTGATEEELASLRDTATDLGIRTRFTARQAADALVTLSRAGFSVVESQEAVADVLNLAQAGGIGLAEAASIAASALRAFSIDASRTDEVVDILAATANSANTNISELGEALKFASPAAAALNVSLAQTNAALALLADRGLRGTISGTALRRGLLRLEAPNTKAAKLLKSLGLSVDEVRVSTQGFLPVLQRLADAGVGVSEATQLLGDRAGPAFGILLDNLDELGRRTTELSDVERGADELARVMDDNLNGAILRTKSAYEGLLLEFGRQGATSALKETFEGIATALRTMADNSEATSNVIIVLSVAITARFIPAMFGATAATVGFNKVLLATTLAVGLVAVKIGQYNDDLEKIGKTLDDIESQSGFAKQGEQIRQAQQELNNLNRSVEAQGGFASQSQITRIQKLQDSINAVRSSLKEQAQAQKESNDEATGTVTTVDDVIRRLTNQAVILRENTKATTAQIEAQKELEALILSGTSVTGSDRARIENAIKVNQQLELQNKLLESIKGPQQEFSANSAALDALLARGVITLAEFNIKLAELQSGIKLQADPFQEVVDGLKEANRLQQERLEGTTLQSDLLRIESQLLDEGVKLTDEQRSILVALKLEQIELNNQKDLANKKQQEANQLAAEEKRTRGRQERLETRIEFGDPRAIQQLSDINELLARRPELADNAVSAIGRLRRSNEELFREGVTGAELFNTALLGLPGIITTIAESITNFSFDEFVDSAVQAGEDIKLGMGNAIQDLIEESQRGFIELGETIVNSLANNATNALVKFAETGKFSIKDFARSVLKDITRIIARLLVLKAIEAATSSFGGGGGAANTVSNVGKAAGGTVQPDRSFIVGEEGPELFQPGRTGTIVPNAASVQQPPPQITLQVNNVTDPNEIPETINNGDADQAFLNMLARNKDKAKRVLV